MSVREQIYVRTDLSAAEVASAAADAVGGSVAHRDTHSWFLVATSRLIHGTSGEFGGPVLHKASEAQFRPADEYEAPDAYNIEIRLWQAHGPRVHAATGEDVEAAAASAVFATLSEALSAPMLHVREGDKLISASRPDRGVHTYPDGVSVYDWDEDEWDGYVLIDSPGAAIE
jgi:hypothetical protein